MDLANLTPAVILGIDTSQLDTQRALRLIAQYEQSARVTPTFDRFSGLSQMSSDLAWSYFIAADWKSLREVCHQPGRRADNYLLGDWMSACKTDAGTYDPDWWMANISWVRQLRQGLCWDAVIGDWDHVGTLLTFPSDRIGLDSNGGKVALCYYRGLAKWWRQPDQTAWIDELKTIRGAGAKGYHLRGDVIRAIAGGDSKAANAGLLAYMKYFVKQEMDWEKISFDGTFLWHLARHLGIDVALDDEYKKHIVIIPEGAAA